MKKILFTALLCNMILCLNAQKISRDYQNQSLSKVLEDLNAATSDQTIYFIYDELEDFTVTTSFKNLQIEEAISQVIGFYPMKVTYDKERIFVECTQKESTKVIGRVVDDLGEPIEFANISLFNEAQITETTGAFINGSANYKINFVVAILDAFVARVGLGLLFGVVFKMEYFGFWLGDALSGTMPLFIGGAFLLSGKWKTRKYVIQEDE